MPLDGQKCECPKADRGPCGFTRAQLSGAHFWIWGGKCACQDRRERICHCVRTRQNPAELAFIGNLVLGNRVILIAVQQKMDSEVPIRSFGSCCRRKPHHWKLSDSLRALGLNRKGWWICFILFQHLSSAWVRIAKDQKGNVQILWSNSGNTACYHSKKVNQWTFHSIELHFMVLNKWRLSSVTSSWARANSWVMVTVSRCSQLLQDFCQLLFCSWSRREYLLFMYLFLMAQLTYHLS